MRNTIHVRLHNLLLRGVVVFIFIAEVFFFLASPSKNCVSAFYLLQLF